ncbi:Coronin-2B [Rhizophlyctis rosea]|uniref:Coronin-2B n=1 Tax=Rhizophlyctis rosea TaxID=64517 RepID=A0AAD5SJK2_9FUNG|nr:Coronin-2B [Rhizophlyctis rosea]
MMNWKRTDFAVETTALHVPRQIAEKVFQEDLYPPIAAVDPSAAADRWFSGESIPPIMMDVVFEAPQPQTGLTVTVIGDDGVEADVELSPVKETMRMDRRVSSTIRRKSSLMPKSASSHPSVGGHSLPVEGEQAHAGGHPQAVYLDGYMDLERKGWLGSVWERRYLSLKTSRLYINADEHSETPLLSVGAADIRLAEGFSIGKGPDGVNLELGFSVDVGDKTYRFRAATQSERDHWLFALRNVAKQSTFGHMISRSSSADLTNSPRGSVVSLGAGRISTASTSLPPLPRAPQPIARTAAALMGELQCLVSPDARKAPQFTSRLVVLDEDAMLHSYVNDIKAYTTGKPPLESMNLSAAISVRLLGEGDIQIGTNGQTSASNITDRTDFIINTAKRTLIFRARRAYEAANWVVQIRRVILAKGVMPAAELIGSEVLEGWVETAKVTAAGGVPSTSELRGRCWLSVINGSFYYSTNPASTTYIHAIPANSFEEVSVVSDPGLNLAMAFDVQIRENNQQVMIRHITESPETLEKWVSGLVQIKRASFDLLAKLGIKSDEALRSEIGMIKSAGELESADGLVVLDEAKLNKGEQKALIGVFGKVRLTFGYVECSWNSLRSDAAFVLDVGNVVYHYNGPNASRVCRARAMDVATSIRKSRSNRPRVLLVENDDRELIAKFFSHLTESKPSFDYPVSDEAIVAGMGYVSLFRVQDATSRRKKLNFVYEGVGPSKTLLETDGCYILQSNVEVFAWVGSKSSTESRNVAAVVLKRLMAMIKAGGQNAVFAQRMHEGSESVVWKEKFVDYEGSLPISMRIVEPTKKTTAPTLVQLPIAISPLLSRAVLPSNLLHLPEATTTPSSTSYALFRIDNFQRYPVPAELHGQFFKSESYVLVYRYRPQGSGVERAVGYFWQGSRSGNLDRGTSALMTVELTEGVSGEVMQWRIVESKEPKHFCEIFGSHSVVVRLSLPPPASPTTGSTVAFDIRECFDGVCKAIEFELNEISLNQNHVVLLMTPKSSIIYHGKHAVLSEKQYAKEMAGRYGAKEAKIVFVENLANIPDDLKELIGTAKIAEHLKEEKSWWKAGRYPARLFSVSSGSGLVKVEEVIGVTQEDLDPNIVMILDTGVAAYAWFGTTSKPNEKIIGMETVQVNFTGDNTCIVEQLVTYAYEEPYEFTKHFQAWTRKKFPKDKLTSKPRVRPLAEVLKEYKRETYPLDVLLGDAVPEHVDRTKLEMYLSDEEFDALFKMRKDEYLGLQPWKRDKIKKDLGVF